MRANLTMRTLNAASDIRVPIWPHGNEGGHSGEVRWMPPSPCPVKSRRITVIPLASILNRIAAVARNINLPRKQFCVSPTSLLADTHRAPVSGGGLGILMMAMSIGEPSEKSCKETMSRRSG
jgi:hypothetical protein